MSFPKPRELVDIATNSGIGLSHAEIFRLLTHPNARRLNAPDHPGSWLLSSGGWVFKTHFDDRIPDFLSLLEGLTRVSAFYSRVGIWHPSKQWFSLYDGDDCWLCSATPELPTLKQTPLVRRYSNLIRIAVMTLRTRITFGVYPDPQFENFGLDPTTGDLVYLDDEVYVGIGLWSKAHSGLTVLQLAGARERGPFPPRLCKR